MECKWWVLITGNHLSAWLSVWKVRQDRHNLSLCVLFSQRANAIRDKVGAKVGRCKGCSFHHHMHLPEKWRNGVGGPKNDGVWKMDRNGFKYRNFVVYVKFRECMTHSNQKYMVKTTEHHLGGKDWEGLLVQTNKLGSEHFAMTPWVQDPKKVNQDAATNQTLHRCSGKNSGRVRTMLVAPGWTSCGSTWWLKTIVNFLLNWWFFLSPLILFPLLAARAPSCCCCCCCCCCCPLPPSSLLQHRKKSRLSIFPEGMCSRVRQGQARYSVHPSVDKLQQTCHLSFESVKPS